MPPGHFNALFIKDAEAIYDEDHIKSIEEAAGQGAFIMWNHPGWKVQQPDTMIWWDEHSYLYEKGWLHGIEVVNYGEFYPQAVDWAIEKNLTMIGSSDQHEPFLIERFTAERHRSCTFVFATERSEGGIREALFNGRTAAYTEEKVIGQRSILEALFLQSVQIKTINADKHLYSIINNTDLHFDILLEDRTYNNWTKKIVIKPRHESLFELSPETPPAEIRVNILNFITGTEKVLNIPFSILPSLVQIKLED